MLPMMLDNSRRCSSHLIVSLILVHNKKNIYNDACVCVLTIEVFGRRLMKCRLKHWYDDKSWYSVNHSLKEPLIVHLDQG